MSTLLDHVMTRDKLDIAKELVAQVKKNAELERSKLQLEVEIFWMKVKERDEQGTQRSQ